MVVGCRTFGLQIKRLRPDARRVAQEEVRSAAAGARVVVLRALGAGFIFRCRDQLIAGQCDGITEQMLGIGVRGLDVTSCRQSPHWRARLALGWPGTSATPLTLSVAPGSDVVATIRSDPSMKLTATE